MSGTSNLSIHALSFREVTSGRSLSGSKVRTEYNLLINYHEAISIEVSNSRFSRKKVITMNGSIVEKFNKTRTKDLRYSWNHDVDSFGIEFQVVPNASKSGTDLLVNGSDFFSYVYMVDVEGPDPLRPSHGSFNSFMKFKLPSKRVEQNPTRIPTASSRVVKAPLPRSIPYQPNTAIDRQILADETVTNFDHRHRGIHSSEVAIYPDMNDDDEDNMKLLGKRGDLIEL